MPKKTRDEEDLNAFYEAVKGTKPIQQNKIRLKEKSSKHPPRKMKKEMEEDIEPFQFSETNYLATVTSEEFLSYKKNSISNKILRKLRKGQYNVDAILDLHGMTVESARMSVNQFLQQCLHKEIQVALIIHGKGYHSHMPILKNKLNHWLRETNDVLAFCSATNEYGSRGAIFVLLRRK